MTLGDPAEYILKAAHARDRRLIAVAGTAKNAGKTAVTAALLQALEVTKRPQGVLSLGRDGERADALDGRAKPRLRIGAGTLAVVARGSLRRGMPCELVAELDSRSALGELVVIRASTSLALEVAGPPSAQGVAEAVGLLDAHGAECIIIDGALDRLTALKTLEPGFIIAAGAASATTIQAAAAKAEAVVARLQLPPLPSGTPHVAVEGVLDARRLTELLEDGNVRALLVEEPMRITRDAFASARRSVALYARRAYDVLACSVNAYASERYFEPVALARAVARATQLPALDCYRSAMTLP